MAKNRRSDRIDKKMHRWWLGMAIIDVSQNSFWRARLFRAEFHEAFPIDRNHLEGVPSSGARAISSLDLSYMIAKVPSKEAVPRWLGEGGLVVFKIWATRHPSVCAFSGNNPDYV